MRPPPDPKIRNLVVKPHDLAGYDRLRRTPTTTTSTDPLAARAKALGLYSQIEDWPSFRDEP